MEAPAPQDQAIIGASGRRLNIQTATSNSDAPSKEANLGLSGFALKLATGPGKMTVMAMPIAWQTVNAVRHPTSRRLTRGFLAFASGITIKEMTVRARFSRVTLICPESS